MTRAAAGPRVLTEPLGGSALSLAAQRRSLPAELQPWWPASADEWRSHVERRRPASADWLERLSGAFGSVPERLQDVAKRRGVVITTGQQPGLFGGPVYALTKAITALELANAVGQATGVPVAPVFWAATDDADFFEAAVTFVADADGLHELAQTNAPEPGTPMSAAPLGSLTAQLERLRSACGSGVDSGFFEIVARAYTGEKTIGDAYVRLMRGLLGPLGVAVLDASHRTVRESARPLLLEAQASAATVADARAARVAALRAQGFEPQVEDDRGLSVVFALENGVKRRMRVAEKAPANGVPVSANVLARPVVERELLPTVAYVAGPGELAYFPQSDAVASALGRERLAVVPRWSCTVIEPFVDRAMARLGVQHEELRDVAAIEKRLARAALPEGVSRAWKRLNEQVQASVQELARAVQESSLMPPAVIEGLSRSLGHKLGRADRRILAAVKRRDDATRRDLAAAAAALWPRGQRQERMLSFIPMLARGGAGLIDAMRAAASDYARGLIGASGARSR